MATDYEEEESDELSIVLKDNDKKFQNEWSLVKGSKLSFKAGLKGVKSEVNFGTFTVDEASMDWFFVPQACTVGDKSYSMPKIKTLVGACCSEDLQDGCTLGALYNDEDTCILGGENFKYIFFEDGSKIKYDKLENKFLLDCVGDAQIEAVNNIKIKASKIDMEI